MKYSIKIEIIVELVCLLILLALSIAIYYNGKDLTCDNCNIQFTTQYASNVQDFNKVFNVSVVKLVDKFKEGYCLVDYNEDQGFIQNAKKIE